MKVILVDEFQMGSQSEPLVIKIHKCRRFQKVMNIVADEQIVITMLGPSPVDVNGGVFMTKFIGGNYAKYPRRWRISRLDLFRFQVPVLLQQHHKR